MILTDPEWQAVLLSLKVSSLAVALSLPFGIFFAWLLVRTRFPGKALLDSVLHLPLVLPPVVVGYLLLVSMGRRGFIGEKLYDWFGLTFAFSWRGAVLAAAVRTGRCGRRAAVRLPGGVLELDWDRDSGHIWMTGPAVTVFEGEVD